jgi:hypothetical protein
MLTGFSALMKLLQSSLSIRIMCKEGKFSCKNSLGLDEKFDIGQRCQNGKEEQKIILSC